MLRGRFNIKSSTETHDLQSQKYFKAFWHFEIFRLLAAVYGPNFGRNEIGPQDLFYCLSF
jgi:hypothetical protein